MTHGHRSTRRPGAHPRGVLRPPRGRPDRAAPVRQDHPRTRGCGQRTSEHLLRPRERGGPAPAANAGAGSGRPFRSRGHRRDPARAGALRDASRARGSGRQSGAFPGARQRIAFARARDVGIPRRKGGTGRPLRLRSVGDRRGIVARTLAPGRLPSCVPRIARSRVRTLEAELRADLPRTRPSPTRHHGARGDPSPVLDDDCPLPRSGVERGGVRPRAGLERRYGATLSRYPDRRLHGARTPPVVCERAQAPGQVAQGLPSRFRTPAHPSHARHE